jgi:hypothetical protein
MQRNLYIGGAFLALSYCARRPSSTRQVEHRRPVLKWIRCGPSRCPTTGCWASTVDYTGNVWIGGKAPSGAGSDYYHDNMILKFTQTENS